MNKFITHYEIFEKIGEGGMGVVYKARDLRLDRFVAVKMLPDDKFAGPAIRERFLREARTASSLNHPNIVTIYEVESTGDSHLIAMEYVKGMSLAQMLHGQGLPLAQALKYAIQIAEGVGKAHSAGIVHRDLKPANLMVTDDGIVKILDFGLAKRFDHPQADTLTRTLTDTLTDSGVLVGTVAYMSPEQALGETLDARSDVFSFGVILYEMFVGARPFEGKTPLATLQKIQIEPAPKVRHSRPDVPEAVEEIVQKALEKDRARRFQTTGDMTEGLRAALAEMTTADLGLVHSLSRKLTALTRMPLRWKVASLALLAGFVLMAAFNLSAIRSFLFRTADRDPAKLIDPAATSVQALDASQWTQQGRAYLRRYDRPDNIERAVEAFKKATERDPKFAPGYAGLAEGYARKNALTPDPQWVRLAAESSRKAVELDRDLAVAHQARGIVLLQTQQVEDAAEELNRARELDPRSASAWMWMAEYLGRKGDPTKAEEYYRKAAQLDPNDWSVHRYFGTFFYRNAKYDLALAEWERARELSADNILVLRNLAAAYQKMDRDDDAAAVLQRALEVQPSAGIYNNLATLRFFQGRYEDSAAAFEKAVEFNPTLHLYWGNLGDAHRWIPGNDLKAKTSYERAIQLAGEKLSASPNDAELLSYVALYAAKSGDKKLALEHLDRIERVAQRNPATYYKSAVVYEIAGNRPNALRDLETALRLGYPLKEVQTEPELVSLRSDRAYHQMISRIQTQSK